MLEVKLSTQVGRNRKMTKFINPRLAIRLIESERDLFLCLMCSVKKAMLKIANAQKRYSENNFSIKMNKPFLKNKIYLIKLNLKNSSPDPLTIAIFKG